MKAAWVIARREVFAFFVSPMAYVVLVAWLLWTGLSYYLLAAYYASELSVSPTDTPLSAFFGRSIFFFVPLLVFAPVLTMRLLAEERRSGTLEALLTTAVTERAVVLGKYAAAMVFWIVLWAPTGLYAWITGYYGDVDAGVVGASYLGILGIGLYYMSVGLLMSAVARNQVVAAVLAFLVLGLFFAIGMGEFVFQGTARQVLSYLSIWGHMDSFSKGIVDSRYLVFDVSVAALSLFICVRLLEARRWQV